MRDLAPEIFRQRMVIEGTVTCEAISQIEIQGLLTKLCKNLDMVQLTPATTHRSERFGNCGWMHWETSGVHMYAWEKDNGAFFSIDIYTCKQFEPEDAVKTVKNFFACELDEIEWKEV